MKRKFAMKRASAMALATIMAVSPIHNTVAAEPTQHWADNIMDQWYQDGLISGYEDGTLRPDQAVTRAEFVYMINRALGLEKMGNVSFFDVSPEDWFYHGIAIATGEEYAVGNNGHFDPNEYVTRAQGAVFGYNVSGRPSGATSNFTDADQIPEWAKLAIDAMSSCGFLSGMPDGSYNPDGYMTRAEAVSFLERIRKELMGETSSMQQQETQEVLGMQEEAEEVKSLLIDKPSQVFENYLVRTDVTIANTIREGKATLKDMTINGDLIIRGGGSLLS